MFTLWDSLQHKILLACRPPIDPNFDQISATYIDPNLVGYNVIALDDKAVKFYAGSFRSVSHSNYMLV